MPTDHRAKLADIRRFDQLVAYLRDEMGWPIDSSDFEELTFEYTPEELGIDEKSAAKIQEIKRLRPLVANQPWGIFFVKFEPKRLPVVALRRILGQVALKKRASANKSERQAWAADDLLFVSSYGEGGERRIAFANFAKPANGDDLPTLKVLGWDNLDTPLHLDDVAEKLVRDLSWPDDPDDETTWRTRWRAAFTLRHREVVTTSRELSIRLAELARAIRDRINTALAIETEKGPLTRLMKAFQRVLVHDLDATGFADMYAQTIAYGLLSARIADPHRKTADDFAAHMRTNPFLRELMETFLKVGGRRGKAGGPGIDFDELGVSEVVELLDDANMEAVVRDFGDLNPQEDPVIHFYELFLKEYDAKKRMQRGVFYTPRPVVSYIVRSVDELLRAEFGLADGLADTTTWNEMAKRYEGLNIPEGVSPDQDFVQILDPATGTGTFLVEVLDFIHKTLVAKWKALGHGEKKIDGLWNEYVPKHLLTRLHGYELLMAPYAIAHLKIGLKLYETGYRFGSDERARVYLTNALEPAQDFSGQFEFAIPALAHEAQAVNTIKQRRRFTVVIGNPPYSNFGQLNKIPFVLTLLEDYKRDLDEKKLNLDDDFIKFIRLSQHLLDSSAAGVFGMITNNSFVDGITHRQMRHSLLRSFRRLYVLNLHGSSKKKERTPDGSDDENIFDIQQGVATTIAIVGRAKGMAQVLAGDLWGKRTVKYETLALGSVGSLNWSLLQLDPRYFFFSARNLDDGGEYNEWIGLKTMFAVSGNGVKTERDGVSIHFTRSEIEASVHDFQRLPEATLREKYNTGKDSRDWTIKRAKADVIERKGQPLYRQLLYRPFDFRHTWYSGQTRGFIGTPAFPTMQHMRDGNIALVTTRQTAEQFDLLCTDKLVGHKSVAAYDINTAFPLYVFEDALTGRIGSSQGLKKRPNLSPQFLKSLALWLGLSQKGVEGMPDGVTPEDIFHYAYGVFHSPGYRNRYAEFLRIDFPRLPLTQSLDLFRALARLGGELVAVHLLESSKLDRPITEYLGGRGPEVEKVVWTKNTVWLDKAQSSGFKGVREDVWDFHVGGYQVCEKWLKDRKGRTLSQEDIVYYQRIIVALAETIRLMKKIDEVIEDSEGWPSAFQSASTHPSQRVGNKQ